jgi:hypothetical protein
VIILTRSARYSCPPARRAVCPVSDPSDTGLFFAVTIAGVDSGGCRRAPLRLRRNCHSALRPALSALNCPAVEPNTRAGLFLRPRSLPSQKGTIEPELAVIKSS